MRKVLLCVLCFWGCGAPDAGGVPTAEAGVGAALDAGPTTLTLGTGTTAWQPLEEELVLVHGPQGGWHLDLTARIGAGSVEGLVLSYRVTLDGRALEYPVRAVLSARRVLREGDHWVRVGDRAVLDIGAPAEVAGRTVEVVATLSRAEGAEVARDARSVRVVDRGR